MFMEASTPSSILNVWRNTLSLYKNTLAKTWPFIALIMLFIGLFQPQLDTLQSKKVTNADIITHLQQQPKAILILIALALTFLMLLWAYTNNALIKRLYDLSKDQNAPVKTALTTVLHKFLVLLMATIIVFALVALGVIALALPGIFIMVMLFFTTPFILFDNLGIFKSLSESCKLVWGNWWRTFLIIFVPFLLLSFLFNAFTIFLTNAAKLPLLADIMDGVLFGFLTSLIQTLVVVQFRDLKLRKAQKNISLQPIEQ
jgi:hypothetical protein